MGGATPVKLDQLLYPKVYPRVGGATRMLAYRRNPQVGLSRVGGATVPFDDLFETPTVYPRVGGATSYVVDEADGVGGLSPAWAGQPGHPALIVEVFPVYPRVGGATTAATNTLSLRTGLSPRGRGNHGQVPDAQQQQRSIPAWAGQPAPPCGDQTPQRVYPRVGGATPTWSGVVWSGWGLSPRGRGNRDVAVPQLVLLGSIPAWAGQPQVSERECYPCTVYPAWAGQPEKYGLKDVTIQVYPRVGGQPSLSTRMASSTAVYPRVGGATVMYSSTPVYGAGLSPRGRGNRSVLCDRTMRCRSIPAWAGNLSNVPRDWICYGSIPAWAGQPLSARIVPAPEPGLSPRGRGNPFPPQPQEPLTRSIPAWAGQPSSD